MKTYSRYLFIYSFTSFLFVIIFGTLNAPLKKAFQGTEIWDNIMAFHNHFDQLCWLGAAAIGVVFFYFSNKYKGSNRIVRLFTISYIYGTLVFSIAFLVRCVGIYLDIDLLRKILFVVMVSTSGIAYILLFISGIYILKLMINKHDD